MKLKHIFLLFGVSAMMFINLHCNDKPDPVPEPEPQLPPLTHEGKNTFGCLVNGEVWLPDVDGGMGVVHELDADYYNGFFDLDANIFTKSKDQMISITVYDVIIKDRTYNLNYKKPGIGYYLSYDKFCEARTDSLNNGQINFYFIDTIKRIISGTFEFTVYSPECDTIKITDGRFDVKYVY